MISVALIGPDGAGKTTITRMLQHSSSLPFKYLYMGINIEASNAAVPTSYLAEFLKRRFRRNRNGHDGVPGAAPNPPPSKRVGAFVWNSARLVNRLVDEWYRQLLAWSYQLRGYIVLYDRHFRFDFLREVRDEPFDQRLHRLLVTRFYPRPDLIIYLDAPAEVLYARKGEKDLIDLEARRQAFLRVGSRMRDFVTVDAAQPLESVYGRIHQLITEQYDRRKFRGNGPLPNTASTIERPLGFLSSPCARTRERRSSLTPHPMLRVLTYHRVAEPDPGVSDPTQISATPPDFVRQMEYLAHNYNAISIEQLLHSIESNQPLAEKSVLVTFDDGYCDFEEIAWPVLQRLGIPVTLFVATAYPGDSGRMFWWDQLYGAFMYSPKLELHVPPLGRLPLRDQNERIASLRKTKRCLKSIAHRDAMQLVGQICDRLAARSPRGPTILSWARLRKLSLEGVAVCAHTRTHPLMTQLPPEEVRWEVRGALEDLGRELGIALPVLAYPSGAHDPIITRILREEHFSLAFTTLDGHNDIRSADLLRLRRTNITLRTSMAVFRFRLLRVGTYIDVVRHGRLRQALSTFSQ